MQADLRLCWLHIPHCWKSHALALIIMKVPKYIIWIVPELSQTKYLPLCNCPDTFLLFSDVLMLELEITDVFFSTGITGVDIGVLIGTLGTDTFLFFKEAS